MRLGLYVASDYSVAHNYFQVGVVNLALAYGFDLTDKEVNDLKEYIRSDEPSTDVVRTVWSLAHRGTDYLNENVAPSGHQFDWNENGLSLYSKEYWEGEIKESQFASA
jgi:hypothetical protein